MSRGAAIPKGQSGEAVRTQWAGGFVWPALLAIIILVASGRSAVASPFLFPHADKVIHFFMFGLLGTLVLRTDSVWRQLRWRGWLAIALVSLFGIADEFRQSFTPGRFVEVADWMADTLGACVAVSAYLFWTGYRTLLEKPLRARRDDLASIVEKSR